MINAFQILLAIIFLINFKVIVIKIGAHLLTLYNLCIYIYVTRELWLSGPVV